MYLREDVNRGERVIKIPSKFIISCDMGRDCELSKGLRDEGADFDKVKHIYMANFLLQDMENEESFYKPYYDTLPKDITNIPMLWSNHEINQLYGSFFVLFICFDYFRPNASEVVLSKFTEIIKRCVMWILCSVVSLLINICMCD